MLPRNLTRMARSTTALDSSLAATRSVDDSSRSGSHRTGSLVAALSALVDHRCGGISSNVRRLAEVGDGIKRTIGKNVIRDAFKSTSRKAMHKFPGVRLVLRRVLVPWHGGAVAGCELVNCAASGESPGKAAMKPRGIHDSW